VLAYNNYLLSNKNKDSVIYNDLILSKELNIDLFSFDNNSFDSNPFLEKNLRNIFKKINKENEKISIYDLKYFYMFFYNLYIEKKVILPIFYLNDINIETNENLKKKNDIYFDSLFSKYNIEIFNDNNINLICNTFILNLRNNGILIDNFIEKKIKNQIIFYTLKKKYLKCNKITFLIMTELL
jgi:hypothetical protein